MATPSTPSMNRRPSASQRPLLPRVPRTTTVVPPTAGSHVDGIEHAESRPDVVATRTHPPSAEQVTARPPPPRPTAPTPSGSHLADQRGDFAAWITIDGELCRAYEGVSHEVAHPGGTKRVIKCVMGVEVGKCYEVHVDTTGYVTRRQTTLMYRKRSSGGSGKSAHSDAVDLSAEPDLEVRLSIDGRWVGTHVVGAAARDRVTTFRGAAVSDALLRRFRFVKSSTTVTNSSRPGSNPAPKPSDVGTIKISIHRVRRGEATSAWIPGKLNMHRHVPEYYAQGVVTYYDQDIVLPQPERYFIVRRLPEDKTQPLCSFEIAYRSMVELRAMGIVPQEMVVPPRETFYVPPLGKPGTAAYRPGVDVVLVNDPTLPAGIVAPRMSQ